MRLFLPFATAAAAGWLLYPTTSAHAGSAAPGALHRIDREGGPQAICPLKHTDVKADIAGFLARVTVTQEFENPSEEKIEAVYTFPLPPNAAVDDMTILVGDRTVRGKIKRREEARAIYEAARKKGHIAGLLDQERPNIFTQAVTNIPPGGKVKVTIRYVETLRYEAGSYEFVFPMVVGPRYIPAKVGDAARITPPVTPPGTRAGHDISIQVSLDAGLPVDFIGSPTHQVVMNRARPEKALVRLVKQATLPNKDFVLQYDVAGKNIKDTLLAYRGERGGFFTFILQPPERVTVEDVAPKEIVFVLDTSGSMSGFPIEKAKEAMRLSLEGLYPRDSFNLITFAGDTHVLFPAPVPATAENLRKAREFLASRSGGGGTEMMKAIRAALAPSAEQEHVRIVCFMTDGYVGNDVEILSEIRRYANARVFSFGIGSSVNRFLLDKMADEGRGEVEYVGLQDDGSAAARRFHERIRNPLLTDIAIDWGGLPVADVYPKRIPDLFGAKPVIVTGRYREAAAGTVRLRGRMSGREFEREIRIDLPAEKSGHEVLATLWARARVDDLMRQDWAGTRQGNANPETRELITKLGLDYRLMTPFTSFVAVEETVVTEGGEPRRIEVPVEMPEGVSYEGVFGEGVQQAAYSQGFRGRAMSTLAAVSGPAPAILREADRREVTKPAILTPSDSDSKLHPALTAVVERLRTGGQATPEEASFVTNGKAEIEVWLADANPGMLAKLKQLGFEFTTGRPLVAKLVTGRIPVAKLAELAALPAVRYVQPVRRR